jgi:acyl carrier protein
MSREEIFKKLNEVFCDVFDDPDIRVNDSTTAADIDGWESLTHITLISSVEDAFDISFSMKEVVKMKNVGEMVDRIEEKI